MHSPASAILLLGTASVVVGLSAAAEQAPATSTARARLVLLGTGTPNADPERWGPAAAIVVNDEAYLVDAGVGIVRRAEAVAAKGVTALRASELRRVFITHLHSDHTLGLPDLMLSPWVLERTTPLDVYGPPGIAAMAQHIEAAWREDIAMRLYGLEPQATRNYKAVTHEIKAGRIFEDRHVRVDAIPVRHGSWPEAFGFRFQTADRVFVISGDTRPSDAIADACQGCDVLMHEVYSAVKLSSRPQEWQTYHRAVHTSTVELAKLAARARPKLLVLYHQLYWGATDADLLREIREAGYAGMVASGRDLESY
ncbi:MAG: MBL fold metallo-hydrolase [Acidobacteria bacterium]|nr:MBL fold metallo-hydrolase [Acidobacteriota bacterium]MCA1648925.1 MBL fold metallo-hydrolase [Acidobacteriota bacterium]